MCIDNILLEHLLLAPSGNLKQQKAIPTTSKRMTALVDQRDKKNDFALLKNSSSCSSDDGMQCAFNIAFTRGLKAIAKQPTRKKID